MEFDQIVDFARIGRRVMRDFFQRLPFLGFSAFVLLSATMGIADSQVPRTRSWREDIHFLHLPDPVPTSSGASKIEVVEVFWYSCAHCNAFEPLLRRWERTKANDVVLRLIPAQWTDIQRADAQLYYTLLRLGRIDLHQAVYDYIHRWHGAMFGGNDDATLALQVEFAEAHGIPAHRFESVRNSKEVADDLIRAQINVRAYRAVVTPSIVVNGRYLTDEKAAGGGAQLIDVANHLIALERRRATEAANRAAPAQ